MAQAAYCSECGTNVFVTADGRCPQGHGPECLSNYTDTTDQPVSTAPETGLPQAPPPGSSMPPVASEYAQPPQKKSKLGLIIGLIFLVFVLCGCGVAALAFFIPGWIDSAEEAVQEQPLVQETTEVVEEGVKPDAERMVEYFYPGFTLLDFALADTQGDVGSYHVIAQSIDSPDFYITFFADRIVQDETEGNNTETSYFDDAALVIWDHPQTITSGLAQFAGPDAMVPEEMRLQIMESFGEMHADLNVTEYGMNSNVKITFRGIHDDDLEAWYDDFTTFESVWDNDIAAGEWNETSLTTSDAE